MNETGLESATVHHYPMHIGDYQKDTAWCSMLEDCAYRRLMDYYYATEKPLPNDPKKLHNICKATTPAEKKAVDSVVGHFFIATETALTNNRCDQIIADYHALAEKNQANGKRGGRPKKKTQSVTQTKPSGFHLANPLGNPNHNPNERQPETSNQYQEEIPPLPPEGEVVGKPPKTFDPLRAAIPTALDSPRFREAWFLWVKHRREIKHPLRETMSAKQLDEMATMGVDRAVAAINFTIAKGWQGLREPDNEQRTAITPVGSGPGGQPQSREQQRESQQHSTIANWAQRKSAEQAALRSNSVRALDGPAVCDEAHSGNDGNPT